MPWPAKKLQMRRPLGSQDSLKVSSQTHNMCQACLGRSKNRKRILLTEECRLMKSVWHINKSLPPVPSFLQSTSVNENPNITKYTYPVHIGTSPMREGTTGSVGTARAGELPWVWGKKVGVGRDGREYRTKIFSFMEVVNVSWEARLGWAGGCSPRPEAGKQKGMDFSSMGDRCGEWGEFLELH